MFRYNCSIPYGEKHSHGTLFIGVNFRTTSVVNMVVSPFREAGVRAIHTGGEVDGHVTMKSPMKLQVQLDVFHSLLV